MPTTILNEYIPACDALKMMVTAPSADKKYNAEPPLNATLQTGQEQYAAEGFKWQRQASNDPAFHSQYEITVEGQ